MQANDVNTAQELPVMEYFYTIQGEGFYTGRPAFFIRLAGCSVGCVWCDVKESWNAADHPLKTIEYLEQKVKLSGADFVVITGGEPAMYDLTTLVKKLQELPVEIAIETSGAYPLIGDVDWYCFSPKKFKEPCAEAYTKANELKVVINHPSDLEWAVDHAKKVSPNCRLYMQVEWSKKERLLPLVIDFVKEHTAWRISTQTHKFMQIP